MKRIFLIPLIFISFVLFSCDAPRLNPLDPENPDNRVGQADGFVYSVSHQPINGVRVTLKYQKISAVSDSLGRYELNNVFMSDDIVYMEKEGLKKDSIPLIWNNRKSVQLGEKTLYYTTGMITGVIRKASTSRDPIAGADVLWKNQNILVKTDSQGKFEFDDIPLESGWIFYSAEGFSSDSVYINLDNQLDNSYVVSDRYLNAVPILHDLKFYSVVENKFPASKTDRKFEVQVSVTDDEGDIDSIFVKCDELKFSKPLIYNITTRYFEGTIKTAELGLSSIEDGIGYSFYILVKDTHNKNFKMASSNIKRIITSYVQITSPANEGTTTATPTFIWQRFQPGFNFYYMVQVFTRETVPVFVWSSDKISKEDTQTITTTTLQSDDYYWIIWCVDDFGNRAASTSGTFSVQ